MRNVAVILAVLAAASSAGAQQTPLLRPAPLTVQEAVQMAVTANKNIAAADFDRTEAEQRLLAARGAYEPHLLVEATRRRANIPVASLVLGGSDGRLVETDFIASPSIVGLFPKWGGAYEVGFVSARLRTSDLFATLNPQYSTSLTATLTQPLLRRFRFDETRREIAVAQQNVNLSKDAFRVVVMDTVTEAVRNYWELAYARSNVEIQQEGLRLAERQLESNRRAVDEGLLAPVAVVEAQVQVETFQQTLAEARQQVQVAENQLKQRILADRSSPIWSVALDPSSPTVAADVNLDPGDAVATAMAKRPELKQLNTQAEINRIDTRLFRELKRPQLDIVASYGLAGLAGAPVTGSPILFDVGDQALLERVNALSIAAGLTPLPAEETGLGVVPPFMTGGLGRSLGSIFGLDFPTTRIGFVFSMPLFNRTAEANLEASITAGRRLAAETDSMELEIEAEVRNTIAAVTSARERLSAAERQERATLEQYESEQRRFNSGLSSVFLVLVRQIQLIAARTRALRARIDHLQAVADYHRATGQTLDVYGIRVRP